MICEWEDGAVEVRYRNKRIEYEDLLLRPSVVTAAKARPQREPAQPRRSKPALNHPWREGHEERRKQLILVAGLRSGGGPTTTARQKKGDTSNEVKRGTFLTRLDTCRVVSLTGCGAELKMSGTCQTLLRLLGRLFRITVS